MKKGFRLSVFDDTPGNNLGFDIKKAFEKENGAGSWTKFYGDRKTESNVDSITFISKDMADFLAFHYGAPGSRVFKPIISSQGEGNLMYGKTAFVYDPKLDKFFSKNNVDVLMAASADKLKLYSDPTEMLQVPKDKLYTAEGVPESKIIKLPLEAIGIQKIPDHWTPAKLAPSVINNHTDVNMARELYTDYYSIDLNKNINNITEMLENPFIEAELIRQIKSGQSTGKVEDLEFLDGFQSTNSMHLEWLNVSEYASIDVFGSHAKMNPIKAKFLDSIMAPKSEYMDKGVKYRYGAKSVISQHLGIELQGTKFNPETGKIERYGEMMLPYDVGAEAIDFTGRNFKVKVVNKKTNELFDAKEIFDKLGAYKNFKWEDIKNSTRPLETLFNIFERTALKDYDIAVSVMRYPRTRPNDLTFLRLRGFVERGSGNTSIVNPFDVYHIFEGDYDIDAVDYFWAGSNAWYNNIKKQQKVFVPTVDVSRGAPEMLPGIEFSPRNPQAVGKEWQTLHSNQRSLSGARGLVQATSALVKHVDNLAAVRDGKKILLRNPNKKQGELGYWEVEIDWDNVDFHLRQAFEGQLLLDATAPSGDMVNNIKNWRYDFLFPTMEKSLASSDFYSTDPRTRAKKYNTNHLRLFLDHKKSGKNEYADHRVRLFRRYEWVMENGEMVQKEVDLRSIDKDIITKIFRQYSQLLEVTPGRKVYTSGNSRNASYDDMLIRSKKYFTYAENFSSDIFKKLYYSQDYDTQLGGTRYKYQGAPGNNINAGDITEYFNPKPKTWTTYNKETGASVRNYSKYTRNPQTNPFPRQVIENMTSISKGERGGIIERMLYKIYNEDPLNQLYTDTRVLTNESYIRETKLDYQLLNSETFNVAEYTNLMPKLMGEIKRDIDQIRRLKWQAAWFAKSRARNKWKKLNHLNSQIKDLEQKLLPLLKKEYLRTRSAKDIEMPNIVEIQNNKNIIDGTVQYYVANHFATFAGPASNPGQLKIDLKEHRSMIGAEFGNLTELHGYGYGRRSIHTDEIKRKLMNTKSAADIEVSSEELMIRNVARHGMTYLWNFAMPGVSNIQNKIGVFNGNVMPVSVKPSSNYRRVIEFLIKGKNQLLPKEVYEKTSPDQFETMLKYIAEIDFTWRRYFTGTSQHLPMDAAEVNKLLTYGAPKWHWKLKNMFSNYTDIKIDKPIDEFNPFGMGRKYDMNIAFFRSLSNADRAVYGKEFDGGASILSYTNQLMMENGYMMPQKHLALMSDVKSKLGPIMDKVFPSQIDVNTGQVQPLRPFDMLNNPLYVLMGGNTGMKGSGLTLDPWRAMNKFEQNSVNRMANQIKDMKEAHRDHWNEAFFEKNVREDINKKPEDC